MSVDRQLLVLVQDEDIFQGYHTPDPVSLNKPAYHWMQDFGECSRSYCMLPPEVKIFLVMLLDRNYEVGFLQVELCHPVPLHLEILC